MAVKLSCLFNWVTRCSLLVVVSFIFLPPSRILAQQTNTWQRIASLPTGVFFAGGSRSKQHYVVTGGITCTGQSSNAIQVLNLKKFKWNIAGRMPRDRYDHAQTTLNDGRILIAGGRSGNVTNRANVKFLCDAFIWDLKTKTFTRLPDLPTSAIGPSAHTLKDGQSVVITKNVISVLSADHTTWRTQFKLRNIHTNHAAIAVSDHHLLIAAGSWQCRFELVDLKTDTSQLLHCRLPTPIDDLAMVQLDNGPIWITGGQDMHTGDSVTNSWMLELNIHHPKDAKLTAGPAINPPFGVSDHQLVQLGHRLIGIGGEVQLSRKDTELSLAWQIDTKHSTYTSLPNMIEPHDDALALRVDNQLLVIGGYQKKPLLFGLFPIPTASRTVERIVLENEEK